MNSELKIIPSTKYERRMLELVESGMAPFSYDKLPLFSSVKEALSQSCFEGLELNPEFGEYNFIAKYVNSEAQSKFISALQSINPELIEKFFRLNYSEKELLVLCFNLGEELPNLSFFRGDNFCLDIGWDGIDFAQGSLETATKYANWRRNPVIVQVPFKNILPLFAKGFIRSIGSEGHIWRNSTMIEFKWGEGYDTFKNRDEILKYVNVYKFDPSVVE